MILLSSHVHGCPALLVAAVQKFGGAFAQDRDGFGAAIDGSQVQCGAATVIGARKVGTGFQQLPNQTVMIALEIIYIMKNVLYLEINMYYLCRAM